MATATFRSKALVLLSLIELVCCCYFLCEAVGVLGLVLPCGRVFPFFGHASNGCFTLGVLLLQ